MWVILTYDVGVKRNSKVLKICRRYLLHVQKSVFEGQIDRKSLEKLKYDLKKVIDTDSDQISIYEFASLRYVSKNTIGYHIQSDNII